MQADDCCCLNLQADGAVSKIAVTLQRAKVNSLKGKVEHLVKAWAQEQSCSGKAGVSKPQLDAVSKQVNPQSFSSLFTCHACGNVADRFSNHAHE